MKKNWPTRWLGTCWARWMSGGAAVVIATPAHRRAIETRLTRAHADLAAAARSGAYLALDARDTLHALMPGGRLDPGCFERVIGDVITRAGQAGQPVRAYGEMVSLLWDCGLVNAAVELEEMWDRMGLQQPVLAAVQLSGRIGDRPRPPGGVRRGVPSAPGGDRPGAGRRGARGDARVRSVP